MSLCAHRSETLGRRPRKARRDARAEMQQRQQRITNVFPERHRRRVLALRDRRPPRGGTYVPSLPRHVAAPSADLFDHHASEELQEEKWRVAMGLAALQPPASA